MALKNRRAKTRDTQNTPHREGDIIGISDADPGVDIPKPANRGSGHATGIDVREHASGMGDLHRSKGATGIDMGGGGEGTDIDPNSARPHSAEDQEE